MGGDGGTGGWRGKLEGTLAKDTYTAPHKMPWPQAASSRKLLYGALTSQPLGWSEL
jgi:hypothetical protein